MTLDAIDFRPAVTSALQGVFSDMLSLPLAAAMRDSTLSLRERIAATVEIGGETFQGTIFIQVSSAFALKLAVAMLGMGEEELGGESEINDTMSEISNIVAGAIKTYLCDRGDMCAISTPSVMRGTSFVVETGETLRKDRYLFISGDHELLVDVRISGP